MTPAEAYADFQSRYQPIRCLGFRRLAKLETLPCYILGREQLHQFIADSCGGIVNVITDSKVQSEYMKVFAAEPTDTFYCLADDMDKARAFIEELRRQPPTIKTKATPSFARRLFAATIWLVGMALLAHFCT